jgi:hypothetical protein
VATYCSTNDVGLALNLTAQTGGDDAHLTRIIEAASNWIDRYCNQPSGGFAVTADTTRQYLACDVRGNELLLDVSLLAVTSITNGDMGAIPSNGYRLWPVNGARKWRIQLLSTYGSVWDVAEDDDVISVTGRFGYSATVPAAVREACIMLAGWMLKRYQAALQDAAFSPELGQLTYSEAMPKQVQALLAPFRSGMRYL